MPTYGYRCDQCGHELEVFQAMSAAPLTACPECGGKLNRIFYPVGVHFKGSGFYSTDYKSGSNGGSNGGSKSTPSGDTSSSSSASSSEGGSGDKPAAGAKPAEKPAPSSTSG